MADKFRTEIRDSIVKQYSINEHGIITDLGKFQTEMCYVPYFWEIGMNGFADEDADGVWFFVIDDDDRELFPDLGEAYGIALDQSEQGFVGSTVFDTKAEYLESLARCEDVIREESEL